MTTGVTTGVTTAATPPNHPAPRNRPSQILDTSPSSTLVSDWARFLNNPSLSDVTLVVGGVPVPAHRVVLAARCNYFRAMFESGMRDAAAPQVGGNLRFPST